MKIGNICNASFCANNVSAAQTNSKTNATLLNENAQDTVELSNKKSKQKKIIAGAAVTAGAILIGLAVIKKKKAMNKIPEDLKELFNSIKNKEGQEFIDDAYSGIVKHMGLEGIAPKKINITQQSDGLFSAARGGFYPTKNTIEYSRGFKTNLKKAQQFNLLSHELQHCKQFNQIVQTEGLGVEALAKSYANASLKKMLGQDIEKELIKTHGAEKGKELLNKKKSDRVAELIPEIKEKYAKTLSMEKIAANSPEGLQAKKYAEAFSNYEGIGMFGIGGENYYANPLEKEAYAFGNKMEQYFRDSQSLLSRISNSIKVNFKAIGQSKS